MLIYLSFSNKMWHQAIRLNKPLFIYFNGIKIGELLKNQKLSLELPASQGLLQVGYHYEAGRMLAYPEDHVFRIDTCRWKSDSFLIDPTYHEQEFIVGSKSWVWFSIFNVQEMLLVDHLLFIRQK